MSDERYRTYKRYGPRCLRERVCWASGVVCLRKTEKYGQAAHPSRQFPGHCVEMMAIHATILTIVDA